MSNRYLLTSLAACALALGACDQRVPDANDIATSEGTAQDALMDAMLGGKPTADELPGDALSAVLGTADIPYPVYPNGSKYRVGGENGLKIVVFQTEDDFDQVDSYYESLSAESGMPRLAAMNDYVRYSRSAADEDPWATSRPGIVIHEFNDEIEQRAFGARASARTNIIMSF